MANRSFENLERAFMGNDHKGDEMGIRNRKQSTKNMMKKGRTLIAAGALAAVSCTLVSTGLSEDKDKTGTARDRDTTASTLANAPLLRFNRASELIGMNVKNRENEKVGEVKDLIVDLHCGHVAYAVVSSGGILGVGDKLVAVPARSFEYSEADKKLVLNVDKQILANAPRFEKDRWPDLSDVGWNTDVYQHYGQQPYWSDRSGVIPGRENVRTKTDINVQPEVDNTKRNIRDRDGATLTPEDQGNNEQDREITRLIRRSIVIEPEADKDSLNARNIKIITVNGLVTLRGVVESQAEKDSIEARAKRVAGVTKVNNQLELKNK
jgi:sporulation protein YlmC with PRC-barrel domain